MKLGTEQLKKLTVHDAAGAGVAIAMSLALLLGVVRPISNHNRQIAAHLQSSARERQRVAGLVTAIRTLESGVEKSRAELAASPLHIMPPEAVNQRLADLAALAGECGLTIHDIKPGELVRGDRCNAIPIAITGAGNYRDCAVFIHRMHDRLPDVDLCQFKLSGTCGDGQSTGHFDFGLHWFTAADEPARPPVVTAGVQ